MGEHGLVQAAQVSSKGAFRQAIESGPVGLHLPPAWAPVDDALSPPRRRLEGRRVRRSRLRFEGTSSSVGAWSSGGRCAGAQQEGRELHGGGRASPPPSFDELLPATSLATLCPLLRLLWAFSVCSYNQTADCCTHLLPLAAIRNCDGR